MAKQVLEPKCPDSQSQDFLYGKISKPLQLYSTLIVCNYILFIGLKNSIQIELQLQKKSWLIQTNAKNQLPIVFTNGLKQHVYSLKV